MTLVGREGFYAPGCIDTPEKLNHEVLPLKRASCSKVKLGGMSDDGYKHAQSVYEVFKCEDVCDYR